MENVNIELLKSPNANSRNKLFACLDARRLAVRYSSEIMLSSSENLLGIGAKWTQWDLPMDREYSTWWNYGVGQARVKAADTHQVIVKAWNGKNQVTEIFMCVCLFLGSISSRFGNAVYPPGLGTRAR